MTDLSLVILYVADPVASAAFYAGLLGRQAVEASPTFAMFRLASGGALALWSRHTVEPGATLPGGAELAFEVADIDAIHTAWASRGLEIVQAPTEMDFGRTFVALDPDGHRLRAFVPGPA